MVPTPFRVLMTDRAWPDSALERTLFGAQGGEVIDAPAGDEETLVRLASTVDAIATNWAKVTDKVIRTSKGCRVVARLGIGLDNIAVATATELQIPVCNCPDYCIDEVSDHAIGMLLACARRIGFLHHRTKLGEYNLAAAGMPKRVRGQTLGLLGLGRTARAMIPKAHALGLTVIAHNQSGRDQGTGIEMVSLDALLGRSDFLSLHAPLTPSTRQLMNDARLAQMKPTAYLINTSRGGLIDEAALARALQAGKLAGAALDVFDPEPCDLSQPLFRDERVLVTPHAAFISEESLIDMRTRIAQQILQVMRGERPDNLVNPDAYRA